VKVALGVLVLLLATACSAGEEPMGERIPGPSPRSTDKSTTAPPEKSPRQRLRAAQLALSRVTGGAYEVSVGATGLDHPIIAERGRFDVLHEVVDVVRSVRLPTSENEDEATSYVMRVRSSGKQRFMQFEDWGPWDGCWAEMGHATMATLGVDLASVPNIPLPVSLVLDARLPRGNRPALSRPSGRATIRPAVARPAADELIVLTGGFTALQMLGIGGRVLMDLDPVVVRARVPVTLTFFARFPEIVQHVYLNGTATAEALRATTADLDRDLMALVNSAYANTTFIEAVTPVVFESPEADVLLPSNATRDQTCPVNLD
jgi:hypothetical protein